MQKSEDFSEENFGNLTENVKEGQNQGKKRYGKCGKWRKNKGKIVEWKMWKVEKNKGKIVEKNGRIRSFLRYVFTFEDLCYNHSVGLFLFLLEKNGKEEMQT